MSRRFFTPDVNARARLDGAMKRPQCHRGCADARFTLAPGIAVVCNGWTSLVCAANLSVEITGLSSRLWVLMYPRTPGGRWVTGRPAVEPP
jgi:hypothetical protein